MIPIAKSVREQVALSFDQPNFYATEGLVHELFESQVRRTPFATAVVCGEASLSYEELNARANQLAQRLAELGVEPDDRVAICIERSLDMVVGLLGILKSGAAYVPLDPGYPEERLVYMLRDSVPKALVSHALVGAGLVGRLVGAAEKMKLVNLAPDARIGRGCEVQPGVARNEAADALPPREIGVTSNHLAYVIYTSGSTGRPKGVMVEHRALSNFLSAMTQEPGIAQDDVLLATTSLSFDIAGLEIYLPLIHGAMLVVAERDEMLDPNRLAILMRRHRVSMMQATPTTWRMLVSQDLPTARQLKVLCGGEALPTNLAQALIERVESVWNLYGPTETTIWSSVQRLTMKSIDGQQPSIGRPIANTRMHVLDTELRPVPIGVIGELFIGGDGLARGYLHNPELTAECFIPDPFRPGETLYRTGDLGRCRIDGSFDCLGRLDQQVKIRGFRIELAEVEAKLTAVDGVQDAAVVAHESQPGEKHLLAYYVGDVLAEQLRVAVATSLPHYMVPSVFIRMDRLPVTPNGKLNRKALPVESRAKLSHKRASVTSNFEPRYPPTLLFFAAAGCRSDQREHIEQIAPHGPP